MISAREKGFVHRYAELAGLTEAERRTLMLEEVGVYSSRELNQGTFERLMARLEDTLWSRVGLGLVRDPRHCRQCGSHLERAPGGRGVCLAGCESRKVAAWEEEYWRSKLPARGASSSRQVWRLRQSWNAFRRHVPDADDRYLAGIIRRAKRPGDAYGPDDLLDADGRLIWALVTPAAASAAIDALRDRLSHSPSETAAQ